MWISLNAVKSTYTTCLSCKPGGSACTRWCDTNKSRLLLGPVELHLYFRLSTRKMHHSWQRRKGNLWQFDGILLDANTGADSIEATGKNDALPTLQTAEKVSFCSGTILPRLHKLSGIKCSCSLSVPTCTIIVKNAAPRSVFAAKNSAKCVCGHGSSRTPADGLHLIMHRTIGLTRYIGPPTLTLTLTLVH